MLGKIEELQEFDGSVNRLRMKLEEVKQIVKGKNEMSDIEHEYKAI